MRKLAVRLCFCSLNRKVVGVNGKELTVYSSVRDTATLPCNHNHSHSYLNCSLIAWINSHAGTTYSTELVMDGNVKDKNQEKSGKLRVESNCSLRINNLTTADVGRYYCRLYNKNKVYYTDAPGIYLSLLSISASSPVTELKIGSTVTLHCEHHSDGLCGNSTGVTWVSETGTPLQGDGYKVSDLKCSSTLTVTLQRSDRNMKWRCQLTENRKQKASRSYTTTFSDDDMNDNMTSIWIGSGVCGAVVLIVILIIVCKKKTVQKEKTCEHVSGSHTATNQDKEQGGDSVTYAVVNISAAGKRKSDRETAESQTEYATIKTSH